MNIIDQIIKIKGLRIDVLGYQEVEVLNSIELLISQSSLIILTKLLNLLPYRFRLHHFLLYFLFMSEYWFEDTAIEINEVAHSEEIRRLLLFVYDGGKIIRDFEATKGFLNTLFPNSSFLFDRRSMRIIIHIFC